MYKLNELSKLSKLNFQTNRFFNIFNFVCCFFRFNLLIDKHLFAYDLIIIIIRIHDEDSVMSRKNGGVFTLLHKSFGQKIPYLHCYNHRLHFVNDTRSSNDKTIFRSMCNLTDEKPL